MRGSDLNTYIENLGRIILRKEKLVLELRARMTLCDFPQCLSYSLTAPLYYLWQDVLGQIEKVKESRCCGHAPATWSKPESEERIERLEQLAQLLDNLENYGNLVARMIDHCDTGSRALPVTTEKANLNGTITRCAEMLRLHPLYRTSIEIELKLNRFIPDPDLLDCECFQIIHNLSANAIEAMVKTENGRLAMRTDISGEHLFLDISDNGCGIPHEVGDKVFEPFYSTKWSPGDRMKHPGLGLYTISRIIGTNGGKIKYESNPCKKTTFRVLLPVAKRAGKGSDENEGGRAGRFGTASRTADGENARGITTAKRDHRDRTGGAFLITSSPSAQQDACLMSN